MKIDGRLSFVESEAMNENEWSGKRGKKEAERTAILFPLDMYK